MTILQEADYIIRKSNLDSPLNYLSDYIEEQGGMLTEAEYVEVLSIILENATAELTKLSKLMKDNKEHVANLKKGKPFKRGAAEKVAASAELKAAISDGRKLLWAYTKELTKWQNLKHAAGAGWKATKEAPGKAWKYAKESPTKIKNAARDLPKNAQKLARKGIKQVTKHPYIAGGAAAGTAAAGGLATYAASQKRKAAREKLGI